jgi:hypothetical protein
LTPHNLSGRGHGQVPWWICHRAPLSHARESAGSPRFGPTLRSAAHLARPRPSLTAEQEFESMRSGRIRGRSGMVTLVLTPRTECAEHLFTPLCETS